MLFTIVVSCHFALFGVVFRYFAIWLFAFIVLFKIPRSKNPTCEHAAIAARQRGQGGMIISGRRDEDWMDFRDIYYFFKLKKQLSEALAKQADVQKQVDVTNKPSPPKAKHSNLL